MTIMVSCLHWTAIKSVAQTGSLFLHLGSVKALSYKALLRLTIKTFIFVQKLKILRFFYEFLIFFTDERAVKFCFLFIHGEEDVENTMRKEEKRSFVKLASNTRRELREFRVLHVKFEYIMVADFLYLPNNR